MTCSTAAPMHIEFTAYIFAAGFGGLVVNATRQQWLTRSIPLVEVLPEAWIHLSC